MYVCICICTITKLIDVVLERSLSFSNITELMNVDIEKINWVSVTS